jgi:hypothetical protein
MCWNNMNKQMIPWAFVKSYSEHKQQQNQDFENITEIWKTAMLASQRNITHTQYSTLIPPF